MKIAFTTTGKEWNSKLDQRFGRAKGFLIFDDAKNELAWFSNEENINSPHGAGTRAAQYVANIGIDVLITVNLGPKASEILKAANIKLYNAPSDLTVKEAYNKYKNNELEILNN